MADLLQRLREEHRNVARLLAALDRQLAVFNAGGQPDYDLVLAAVEYLRDYAGRYHHPAEDLVYRKLCQRAPARAERAGDLLADHGRLEVLTDRFLEVVRRVTRGATEPRDWFDHEAFAFIDGHRRHMRAEDTRLFDEAERELSPEDWRELAAAARGAPDPLFGAVAEKRFAELRREIDALASAK